MKKNLYYRTVLSRRNPLKEFFVNVFLGLASWPRLLLEVFIRKNFGERYFSFGVAIFVGLLLLLGPDLFGLIKFFILGPYYARQSAGTWANFWLTKSTWYLFVLGFLYMSFLRKREIKRNPSVFDFAKFSLYAGDINPFFYRFNFFGKPNTRTVETLLEPAFFFVIGAVLYWLDQPVGMLILICSILYGFSYVAAYYKGDEYVMDQIDERICNEDILESFIEDTDTSQRGIRCYSRKPVTEENRRKLADDFIEESEEVFVAN